VDLHGRHLYTQSFFFFRFNQMLTTKTESQNKLRDIAVTNCLAGKLEILLPLEGLQKRRAEAI